MKHIKIIDLIDKKEVQIVKALKSKEDEIKFVLVKYKDRSTKIRRMTDLKIGLGI